MTGAASLSRRDILRIAQGLNLGWAVQIHICLRPEGTVEPDISRPSGTKDVCGFVVPNVETLGYCRDVPSGQGVRC